jgi:hypothetical protein
MTSNKTVRTLSLRDGEIAVLAHYPAAHNTRGGVHCIHAFVDSFFQVHVAEHRARWVRGSGHCSGR